MDDRWRDLNKLKFEWLNTCCSIKTILPLIQKKIIRAWWPMPIILALRRLWQEDGQKVQDHPDLSVVVSVGQPRP